MQFVVRSARSQMMVALEGVVEREAVCKPAVMRPGVLRSRLLAFVPYQAIVVNVGDDLEAKDREHRLADEKNECRASKADVENNGQSERQRIVLEHAVVPPPRPTPPQPRGFYAPGIPQAVQEIRRRKAVDRHSARRSRYLCDVADRRM